MKNSLLAQLASQNLLVKFIFLLLLTTATLMYAQMPDSTIPFDCPDVPPAKFQFHFDRELIALVVPTALFNTVEDLYIHTYDADAAVFDKLVGYYGERLKEKGWNIPEETGGMQIYILEESGLKTDSTVVGIFGVVKSSADVHLLNIVGRMPLKQTWQLLANLGELGIEIPELKLLGQLALRKSGEPTQPLPSLTLFRIEGVKKPTPSSKMGFNLGGSISYQENHQGHWSYRGHPIERIQIRANEKKQVARISEGLKNTSGDITELLDSLPSQNMSVDVPTFIVEVSERSVIISAREMSDETGLTTLTKSFRTREGEPIHKILIRGNQHTEAGMIREALEEGPEEIEKVPKTLADRIPTLESANLRIEERDAQRTAIITVVDKPLSQHFYLKSFRTREGEPIHAILIRGNQHTEAGMIREALEEGPEEIEKVPKTLADRIPTLESANLRIEERDAQRTAIITIVDKPLSQHFYLKVNPQLGFNRVTGWALGTRIESGLQEATHSSAFFQVWPLNVPLEENGSKFFGEISRGLGNKQNYYRVGGNGVWGKHNKWHIGLTAQFHRSTGIIAPELFTGVDDARTLMRYVLGVKEHQNYYLRKGGEVALRWHPQIDYRMVSTHAFKIVLLAETHDSLQKSTDWHFFNWRSTSKARENPVITPAHMRSVIFNYDFNTLRNRLGWHNTFSVEHSNTAVGSDFDFTRYQLHLRCAYPLGSHRMRTRAVGSFSTAPLPIQRQFAIGGPGLLNGYPLYAFVGDRGFLFNIEYFYYLPQLFILKNLQFDTDSDFFLVFFFDAGQTWHVSDKKYAFEPKGDAGIGLHFGEENSILRFNIARAFESTQSIQFNMMWFYSF